MKNISYYTSHGQRYAKIPATSYRENGKVVKRSDGIYLGRVIDEDKHIFCSAERGVFSYDPATNTFSPAEETYASSLPEEQRKRTKVCLNFGDAYLVHELIRSRGYDQVIRSLPYENKDTLFALVQYYVLRDKANEHAHLWYEGSVAQLYYPEADLTAMGISDCLNSLGNRKTADLFRDAHIRWVKEHSGSGPAVILDSTGVPYGVHFPLTAIYNQNVEISRKVRLTAAVQRDSGYPLLFRSAVGILQDISCVAGSVHDLLSHGIGTDCVLLDAGDFTDDSVEALYQADIGFLTSLTEGDRTLCRTIVENYLDRLFYRKNLVRWGGRAFYILRADCRLGNGRHPAYAYLGCVSDSPSDEAYQAMGIPAGWKLTDGQFQKFLNDAGLFVLLSSRPFRADEILSICYDWKTIAQHLNIRKESSVLTPLQIQKEQMLSGHLLLSVMAETVNAMIRNTLRKYQSSQEELFLSLANQKCFVYRTQATICEPQAAADAFYRQFEIQCPLYLNRTEHGLLPRYDLPKGTEDDG